MVKHRLLWWIMTQLANTIPYSNNSTIYLTRGTKFGLFNLAPVMDAATENALLKDHGPKVLEQVRQCMHLLHPHACCYSWYFITSFFIFHCHRNSTFRCSFWSYMHCGSAGIVWYWFIITCIVYSMHVDWCLAWFRSYSNLMQSKITNYYPSTLAWQQQRWPW